MQSTGEGWDPLLDLMTDDELIRYGELAGDQVRQEWRLGWLQVLSLLGAAGVACVAGLAVQAGEGLMAAGMVGLSMALGYWPYQKARLRRLWKGHCRVVRSELESRRAPGTCEGGTGMAGGQGR